MAEHAATADADLVMRVETLPAGMSHREWTIRDDNHQHCHNKVRLAESPLFLHLSWKETAEHVAQLVGLYRLNLRALLEGQFVRAEDTASPTVEVRLRFVRGEDDGIYIQHHTDGPRLRVGAITR